ncbi:hypothetical protein KA005_35200 [bacterium]|nr:hypothetical protein [bacterium]
MVRLVSWLPPYSGLSSTCSASSDAHLQWMLGRDYKVMAKGMTNRRAKALSRRVQGWDACQDVWLGEVEPPVDYGRPVRVFVKRRLKDGNFCHSYYISTFSLPCKGHFRALCDSRGGANFAAIKVVWVLKSDESITFSVRKALSCSPISLTISWLTSTIEPLLVVGLKVMDGNVSCATC